MRRLLAFFLASFAGDVTTEYVNELEPKLQLNRDQFLSGPITEERRKAALDFFDQQWAWLSSRAGCGAESLGAAGRRCLSDRARDGKWPWEVYYRDPMVVAR